MENHEELENKPSENDEKAIEKERKIAIERQIVLNNVASDNLPDDRSKVAYLLNRSIESRNSDKELVWNFWEVFHQDILRNGVINKEAFKNLTSSSTIIRLRAKIQNEYKLFQAEDRVKMFRGVLEEEKKAAVIQDKPKRYPFYTVYIDETGKNENYLSLGGLWITDAKETTFSSLKLKEWKKVRNIDYEFHFSKVNSSRIEQYKAFFKEFIVLHPSAGFKFTVIKNKGLGLFSSAITDLTVHLLKNGIEHENKSGRAPLPRELQVYIDDEESGSDQLKIENIKERIEGLKIDGLHIDFIEAIQSEKNNYLQVVDLFIASVNRKLNHQNVNNFKDELADYILKLVDFDVSTISKENNTIDNSVVFDFAFKKMNNDTTT